MRPVVALVTGGTKGAGYCISKELVSRIRHSVTYMTSRENTAGYSALLAMELGFGAVERSNFLTMDIRDKKIVKSHRDDMVAKWGGLDILVNNAGIYFKPDENNFSEQAQAIIGTNYFGTLNVIKTFYNDFRPDARIVNITSNLAHVTSRCDSKMTMLKQKARDRFSKVDNYEQLDYLVAEFLTDVDSGRWEEKGWPTCAYSVSKMAINAYTKILQDDFDQSQRDVIVNAVYPASRHKFIYQGDQNILSDQDAAKFVFKVVALQPDSRGTVPRGRIFWDEKRFAQGKLHKDSNEISFHTMHE